MNNLEKKFKEICKPIPTWALCDQIGLDTETAYILNLTTEEKYKAANEYLMSVCPAAKMIGKEYIGKKVIMELDTNGGPLNFWYEIHGDSDDFFKRAKKTFEEYIKNFK